jgi:heterodisulfide reductase subunit A
LFRYDGQRVVTQLEFESELRNSQAVAQSPDGPVCGDADFRANVANVVMILCAGQRNDAIPYCSGVCCMGALMQAMEVKAANPQAHVTILFRDLYLPGEDAGEEEMRKARHAGVEFIRYTPQLPPEVTDQAIEVHDELTGKTRRLPYDRVVLATPLVPQPDASVVARMLGIAQDANGFFPEVHHRLRPQNYAERGIYVCGAAHYPLPWTEAEFQGARAAFKAVRHLRAGQVTSHAPVDWISPRSTPCCVQDAAIVWSHARSRPLTCRSTATHRYWPRSTRRWRARRKMGGRGFWSLGASGAATLRPSWPEPTS